MIAFVAGCSNAPDLSKKETLAKILDQAIELKEIQYRGKRGEELRYAQNESSPYTGWVKLMHKNGQVAHLFQFMDGKMHGIQTGWAKNGQKNYEVHFKENSQDGRVTAWWENGQKMLEGQFKAGKLMSAESWALEGTANGKQVIDGKGKIRIENKAVGFERFIPVENGVASIGSSGREDYLGKILYNSQLQEDRADTYAQSAETIWPLEQWRWWHSVKIPVKVPSTARAKPRRVTVATTKKATRPKPKSIPKAKPEPKKTAPDSKPQVPRVNAKQLKAAIRDMRDQDQFLAEIKVNVAGANVAAFNLYTNIVGVVYRRSWEPLIPRGLAQVRTAKVSVTIRRDGRVLKARIISRTGDPALDRSVQRALDGVRTIGKPFPAGSRDSQRTFTLDFTPRIR